VTDKSEFLNNHIDLIDYICSAWNDFDDITLQNPSSKRNRVSDTKVSEYSSLEQAFTDYQWNGESFENSTRLLLETRKNLLRLMREGTSAEIFVELCRVLHWGGVLTNAITGPVLLKHTRNELVDYFKWIIDSKPFDASSQNFKCFESAPSALLSDSGTTKIYSVINDQCIIYDDRVAASFCFLISRHFNDSQLPPHLTLVVGARKNGNGNRDPSNRAHRFLPKASQPCKNEHARSNLKSNWIISAVASKLLDNDQFKSRVNEYSEKLDFNNQLWIAMRILEASLFMAGHTVPYTALKTSQINKRVM
jgi:hypothetical protein